MWQVLVVVAVAYHVGLVLVLALLAFLIDLGLRWFQRGIVLWLQRSRGFSTPETVNDVVT